jgi:hypothetical protein
MSFVEFSGMALELIKLKPLIVIGVKLVEHAFDLCTIQTLQIENESYLGCVIENESYLGCVDVVLLVLCARFHQP